MVPPMDDDPQDDYEDRRRETAEDDHPEFDPDATPPPTGGRGCLLILALPLLAGLRLLG